MSRRVIIAIAVLATLVVGGVGTYALTRPAAPASEAQAQAQDVSLSSQPGPGEYVEYNDTAIAQADGRVLLFFHAPWCPSCRSIESDILTEGVPEGVTVVKVDFDSRQDLRQKYGVTLQTTFVEVDNTGKEIQKYVANTDPQFSTVLAEML